MVLADPSVPARSTARWHGQAVLNSVLVKISVTFRTSSRQAKGPFAARWRYPLLRRIVVACDASRSASSASNVIQIGRSPLFQFHSAAGSL